MAKEYVMRFLALCRRVFLVAIALPAAVAIAAPAQTPQKPANAEASPASRPFRSSANPHADPNKSLKSCMDHVGMNPVERDRCMRQHCEGRWGQGDCPAGGDFLSDKNAAPHTPLGRCLAEAGMNPFKRNACGWQYCHNNWNTPECAPLKGGNAPPRPN
jgi:hypothetical protein